MTSILQKMMLPPSEPANPPFRMPPAPRTVEETGLEFQLLVELLGKILLLRGKTSLSGLASHLKLPVSVLESIISFMRADRMCELVSRGDSSATTFFQLTEAGKTRAADYLRRNRYAGAAPVSLDAYCAQIERQSQREVSYTRESVAGVFDGIATPDGVLDRLGAAMNSGRAMIIHGPAGSGKTFIAERLGDLLPDHVAVPHAIVVDGEVIQVFDPHIHHAAEQKNAAADSVEIRHLSDTRWVLCKRPVAIAGGEMTLKTLDLEFDEANRYYQAPPHVKANNGIFIVDDLGRQAITPTELMSRWIVPLDRKKDYLTLHTGYKFQIPFDVTVVFSTNMAPADLADDAFLRRLGYKIHVGALSIEKYRQVFMQACDELSVPFSDGQLDYLLRERHFKEGRPLLACYPRDLLRQVHDLAQYENRPPRLDRETLDWAWQNYFASEPAIGSVRMNSGDAWLAGLSAAD